MLIPYQGHTPRIAPDAFVAPTATLIGNVEVEAGASIWYGAVLRGDLGRIVIGRGSNVQDNATLHAPNGGATILREDVTVGHGAVLEGCLIEAGALIGMNAVVLDGATVGEASLVAAGSVVTENMVVPAHVLAAGVPAQIKKPVGGGSADWLSTAAATYRSLAGQHREALEALTASGSRIVP
jgi:carbonic anhydrase/acetyltransferase-like protein (isoleucine patch superfamily)